MRYSPLLGAILGLALLAPPCLAGQVNSTPANQPAASRSAGLLGSSRFGPGGFQSNGAPSVSTALSTALSVGNPANSASLTIDPLDGGRKPVVQFNSAPSVQAAVGAAVAIDGNASALATNGNGVSQGSLSLH